MCTSIAMRSNGLYFGRNMDIDFEFGERVVITPRGFSLSFRNYGVLKKHYGIIGMAAVSENYPLYAEAMNECGLSMAGLNFPDNAVYSGEEENGKANISPFELIPWVLGRCGGVSDVRRLLETTRIIGVPFSERMSLTPLHWHIADANESIVLEVTKKGMEIYDNPVDVLTNNPPFDFHLLNLSQYMNLSVNTPTGILSEFVSPFGKGAGSIGLPGDFSSASRFVKAAYLLKNSVVECDEQKNVSQMFHLLDSVAVVNGSIETQSGGYRTVYSCCMSVQSVTYYYKSYFANQLTAVSLSQETLESDRLIEYPFEKDQLIVHAGKKTPAD